MDELEMIKDMCPDYGTMCDKCNANGQCSVEYTAKSLIIIKKSEYENKEIGSFLRGRESAFSDMESIYNIQKNDVDYIKTIGQIKQDAKREILKELNDEGYRIYKQQGDTFDAGNFNWLIAHTMQKHGIERE